MSSSASAAASELSASSSGATHHRVPLIQFRYGKREGIKSPTHSSPSAAVSTPTPVAAPAPAPSKPSTAPAAKGASQFAATVVRLDFLDVPANFGRLPPLSEKEINFANLGGIMEEEAKPPAKSKAPKKKA